MSEYKVSLHDLDNYWDCGRVLLYLRKIGERYEKQKKAQKGQREVKAMSESELLKSEFGQG